MTIQLFCKPKYFEKSFFALGTRLIEIQTQYQFQFFQCHHICLKILLPGGEKYSYSKFFWSECRKMQARKIPKAYAFQAMMTNHLFSKQCNSNT